MKSSSHRKVMLWGCLLLLGATACSSTNGSEPVRVEVHGLRFVPGTGQVAVVLTDDSRQKYLPIFVGRDQAVAIQLGREGESTPRPLSHDLMANLLKILDAEVDRVTITELKDNTYYAEILLRHGRKTHRVDARPSDAIALALRTEAPIYAMPNLLSEFQESRLPQPPAEEVEAGPWGFAVQPLTEDLAQFFGDAEGVLVADVTADSPADRAGLLPGDILIRLGKQRIRDLSGIREALAAIEEKERVEVVVVRGSETLTLTIQRSE
jgi:bifunctional DNase/RNase